MAATMRIFKVLLIGNSGVGKTAFLRRYLQSRYEDTIEPTIGVEKHVIVLSTTAGDIRYEIWDVSGSQKISALQSEEYNADGAIIMFDLTNRISYNNVPNWYQTIVHKDRSGRNPMPICICANKYDAPSDSKLPAKTITFPRKKGTGYAEVSVMTLQGINEPFLDLARRLLRDPTVQYEYMPDLGDGVFNPAASLHSTRIAANEDYLNSKLPNLLNVQSVPGEVEYISAEESVPSTPRSSAASRKVEDPSEGRLKFLYAPRTAPTPLVNWSDLAVQTQIKPLVIKEKRETAREQSNISPDQGVSVVAVLHEEAMAPATKKEKRSLPKVQQRDLEEQSLFVLCIHCIRMIFVKSIQGTKLAETVEAKTPFSLTTTACRSCCRDFGTSSPVKTCMSPDLIRYTAMYECARKVAEEEVAVLTFKKSVAHIEMEELTEYMGLTCQIQGVSTTPDTIERLSELEKKDVMMSYVPGAFL
ncbi:putative RAN small monomeric GTPase (Ran) [Aspergillus clavatus NRRL 1]|uniref:RAN small monomeric GTPase (Ran), putative n=1 Tax=Aspergillus clavatus (strain ATCC 1007 / CBS 513.65 / DSM 816 / NCTC 3887 / NRRL 1 / QM 1276 / 107) TaxID=344612 RepID=A1C5M7_ASPCL|nr:RAN small monomeric GTPase (Ran), putative [Aspergillus clavatus NRRL 1]EAW14995.1 RAN small monomeric GTPase (Ran), putative [Aspergillus clavatus NRRL 1]